MPSGVLHLKEVDTDKITLDGTLSVSGASRLEGDTIVDGALSVGGSVKFAATETTNINVEGTLSVSGQTTIGGDIIPDTNDAYDIGSPEFKIRDLYVSNNSIWVGDDMKISNDGGKLKFRKRKTNVVPQAILNAGANAGHANEQATADAALAHAGLGDVSQMKLQHWFKFMRTLNSVAKITDIFRDTDDDYEESSASDAWKEINDTKIYTDMNVGVGTSDPDDTLHVKGSFKVESETGFQLIRSTVGADDPQLIIDTKQFGVDETIEDLTGQGLSKFTKLYRVYGTNSEGYGRDWYWGLANDDYTNISLAVGGESGGNDPDLAFTFTTASELYCNKVFAALGGNADTATLAATATTATRLETARKINGVDFDGTSDITIDTGIQGITKPNGGNDVCIQPGKLGVGLGSPGYKLDVESLDFTVARFKQRDAGEGAGIKFENGDGDTWNVATDTDGKFGIYRDGESFSDFSIKDGNVGVGVSDPVGILDVLGGSSSSDSLVYVRNAGNAQTNKGAGIVFENHDSNGNRFSLGHILALRTLNAANYDSYIKFSPTSNGTPFEAMRISSVGNVGIGTTGPEYKLEVESDSIAITRPVNNLNHGCSVNYRLLNSANEKVEYGRVSCSIGDNTDGSEDGFLSLQVRTGGVLDNNYGQEKMRIKSDGEVSMNKLVLSNNLYFGGRTTQHINLWHTDYGSGVQGYTHYFRSGGNFKFYVGGSHNDAEGNSGGGQIVASFDRDGWNRMYQNVHVYRPDNETSELRIHGDVQGTGRLYVGQSAVYGGGIEYNGDNSPATAGAGSDYITLYRTENGTSYWTARNLYNSNTWEFRGEVDGTNVRMRSAGDTYKFIPGNDGWLRLQGAASGQGNMSGSYTSLAIGNLYSAGTTRFSDDRLKHFEEPIQNSLDLIKSLNPFKYKRTKTAYTEDWTGEIGEEGKDWDWEMGLIAQDVLQNEDLNFAVVDESKGPENLYGLDYNHFISLLIQGVKDLKKESDDKQQADEVKITELETQMQLMMTKIEQLSLEINELKSSN